MQRPTCTGIRVYSLADSDVIFHAVTLGLLPLVARRLDLEERRAIHSGCVFVWEERSSSTDVSGVGIERWTDGRRWGPSRARDEFLFYQEKMPEISTSEDISSMMLANRLVKQTYSVFLDLAEGRRKWHMGEPIVLPDESITPVFTGIKPSVAYFAQDQTDQLGTLDDIPELASLRGTVPAGLYKPARLAKGRARNDPSAELYTRMQHYPGAHCTPSQSVSRSPTADIRLPVITPPPWRDPRWVRGSEGSEGPICAPCGRETGYTLAPLVYKRAVAYAVRLPIDNEALRMLDCIP